MDFNLSAWAVRHRAVVVFFMILFVVGGVMSYSRLGRQEDPSFAVPTMVLQTSWPGATTADTMLEVTDRLEKKLRELPHLDYLKSFTKPGQSMIYVNMLESTDPKLLPWLWYDVRKKVDDIRATLPQGIKGPFYNDEFGDVYGIVYGLTFDGFSQREALDFAETVRTAFQTNRNVGKVTIFGNQDEKVYLYLSPQKLASLGINLKQVADALAQQNAVVPAGTIVTDRENIQVEVTGALLTNESLEAISFYINGNFYRLSELATIQRGYVEPPQKMFRVDGKPAIGIGVSMVDGGNIQDFGVQLEQAARQLEAKAPIGLDLHLIANQSEVVKKALGGFTKALVLAIIIVLIVSFASLGLRAGAVVALSIPLVLAVVFIGMDFMQISLQRISLGALIIALGLLVDDAMITVEMMISKIEQGLEKIQAATFAYTSTAFPMLTGTLVTIFAFGPIGFSESGTGQYCFSLFAVIAIALIASWFVAVIFAPVIGLAVLPSHEKYAKEGQEHSDEPTGRIAETFHRVLLLCMRHRWITIGATVGLFALSLVGQSFVQRQFFPASDRLEILATLSLPKSNSIYATKKVVERVEEELNRPPNKDDIDHYSSYIGGGAVRFILPLDVQLDNDFLGQFVIVTKSLKQRDAVIARLNKFFESGFEDVSVRVQQLEMGPPVGWPIQYRVSAATPDETRVLADKVASALRQSGLAQTINYDWSEKNKSITVEVNQDAARRVGLSSQMLSQSLNALFNGQSITQLRDQIYLVDLTARADGVDRASLDTLRNLQINLPSGNSIPISQVATLKYAVSDAYIWRRDRMPTITVQADIIGKLQAATVIGKLEPQIDDLRKNLAPDERIIVGGAVEKSAQSNYYLMLEVPIMAAIMLIVLMFQLQSFSRLVLVLSVAPLGLIGVVIAMLVGNSPLGFVATLGILALVGMIVRNSVILVDQIEHNQAAGMSSWDAVVYAAVHRLRPILLTAAAAILGMIPIMRDVFWAPMAFAVAGGLAGATLLTLLFLPALYIACFRIREEDKEGKVAPAAQPHEA